MGACLGCWGRNRCGCGQRGCRLGFARSRTHRCGCGYGCAFGACKRHFGHFGKLASGGREGADGGGGVVTSGRGAASAVCGLARSGCHGFRSQAASGLGGSGGQGHGADPPGRSKSKKPPGEPGGLGIRKREGGRRAVVASTPLCSGLMTCGGDHLDGLRVGRPAATTDGCGVGGRVRQLFSGP